MKIHAPFTPPNFVIPLNKQIYCFEISPYESSSNLFVAALQNKIVLYLVQFPVRRFFNLIIFLIWNLHETVCQPQSVDL